MRLILGVDEAGYGPNMGPLVIAVSAWALDSSLDVLDGLTPFAPEFQAAPWNPSSDFIPLGDSKKIYQPNKGLAGLNCSIRFFESLIEGKPGKQSPWFEFANLAAQDIDRLESIQWYHRSLHQVINEKRDVLTESAMLFAKEKFLKLGLQLIDVRLRVLEEALFNEMVNQLGNKSDVLGQTSLTLAWNVLDSAVNFNQFESIEIYCDRQGGRKRYSPLLSHTYSLSAPNKQVPFFTTLSETPEASCYSMDYRGIPTTIRFQVGGDSLFAPAASSIVAKWTRESLMQRLNRYWRALVGDSLRPTAGYAVDAARFAKDIAPWIDRLSLDTNLWWRQR